jgi:Cu-Zn family superoxide dismutase
LTAKATIINTTGDQVGTADFTEPPSETQSPSQATSSRLATGPGVTIKLQVSKLPAGRHGIHIHAVGRCDTPAFTSAGPHFNPFGKKHGARNPEGPHAGDLGNITAGSDGTATAEFRDELITLRPDDNNSLLQPLGTSIVIHADPDDEISDPAGNSGNRIACGVIVNPRATPSGGGAGSGSPGGSPR